MDAQKFLAEFGHIANAPHGVLQLRELVLVLAMQGRLVAQAQGEYSSALLERIEEDKRALVAAGSVRASQPLPDVGVAEQICSIPDSWVWVRFGNISMHNSGKTLDSMRNSGHPRDYITTSNLYWGRFELSNVKRMLIRDEEMSKCTARKNDLLICEGGEAGRAAVWTADTEVCFQNHIHRARFYGGVNPFFAYRFFEKLNATGEINAHRKGIGISNLSSKALAMIAMPLPPLEEQGRIVSKVNELMALCDELEALYRTRRHAQIELRKSAIQATAAACSPHELGVSWRRLESNLGQLMNEPEDVGELRNLVLELAVRGLLTPQTDSEESVGDLRARSEQRKRELSRIRKLKLPRSLPELAEDEIPFAAPKGWQWVRFGELTELINGDRGKNYPNKDEYVAEGVPWINTGHIEPDGTLTRQGMNFISREKFNSLSSGKIEKGDLVYCLRGATFGKTAYVTPYEEGAIASSLMIIRPLLEEITPYVYFYLISQLGRSQILKFDNGTAQPNLSANSVALFAFPLPPIDDQRRIALKIGELMKICDELQIQLSRAREVAGRFADGAVNSLTGIAFDEEEKDAVKPPKTELIAPLRIGVSPPDLKARAPLASLLARHSGEMSARDLWQRFGGDIDAFYAQLKTEVAHGWILEPLPGEMREKLSEAAGA